MSTFTGNPVTNDDNAYTSSGTYFNNLGVFKWGSTSFYSDIRIPNVTIPQGATINSCTFQMNVTSSGSGTDIYGTVGFENVDNSATFSSSSTPITRSGNLTATTYNPTRTSLNIVSTTATTGDYSASLQQVINRVGWVSGNAIALISTPTSSTANISFSQFGTSGSLTLPSMTVNYTSSGGTVTKSFSLLGVG